MRQTTHATEWLCLLSHLAFLPAISVAWSSSSVSFFAILLTVVYVISLAYHLIKNPGQDWWHKPGRSPLQTTLLWMDTLAAGIAMGYSLILFQNADWPPSFEIALVAVIPAFVLFMIPSERFYDLRHSLWHVASGVGLYLASLL